MSTKLEAATALHELRGFIGQSQLSAIGAVCRGEEKQFFFDKMVEMADLVKVMPKTYEQDGKGQQAVAYLRYFNANMDWYITEKDIEAEQLQAFGLADLGYGGEIGYISLVELIAAGVELDLYFKPKTLAEIQNKTAQESDHEHL